VAPAAHESVRQQVLQMAAQVRLRQTRGVDQFRDRALAVVQRVEDRQARGLGE